MFRKHAKALFLAPHSDDAELCCGGTIAKLFDFGVHVDIVNVSMATDATVEESTTAAKKLGAQVVHAMYPTRDLQGSRQNILEYFRDLASSKPDYVFIPTRHDTHQDHQTVAEEAFRAFKFGTVLAWETPWNNIEFSPTLFCTFTEDHLKRKLEATDVYKSQLHRHYFSQDYLTAWAKTRGGQVGREYAEAFEVVRMIS